MEHTDALYNDNSADKRPASSAPSFADDIKQALAVLRRGGIILYPTDTVWGLGCDARNSNAVKRIYELKRRADSKSMIVLVDSIAALERSLETFPEVAEQLVEVAVKPLTIIYDHPVGVAPELLASDGSLGIRLTNEDFSKRLCYGLRAPLVSTSANISGKPTPRTFDEIEQEIKDGVDYVVKYRQADTRPASPSGIIKLSDSGEVRIIR